jgi:hypothetical protein
MAHASSDLPLTTQEKAEYLALAFASLIRVHTQHHGRRSPPLCYHEWLRRCLQSLEHAGRILAQIGYRDHVGYRCHKPYLQPYVKQYHIYWSMMALCLGIIPTTTL